MAYNTSSVLLVSPSCLLADVAVAAADVAVDAADGVDAGVGVVWTTEGRATGSMASHCTVLCASRMYPIPPERNAA